MATQGRGLKCYVIYTYGTWNCMYLACIGILRNRGMFLVIPSGSSDFDARIKAFPLLYRYSSAGNLYGSRLFRVLDTDWFQFFRDTMKSVRNTASTIRCDCRSDPVGKTGDPSGVDWKASRFWLVLVGSGGRNHRPGPAYFRLSRAVYIHISDGFRSYPVFSLCCCWSGFRRFLVRRSPTRTTASIFQVNSDRFLLETEQNSLEVDGKSIDSGWFRLELESGKFILGMQDLLLQ